MSSSFYCQKDDCKQAFYDLTDICGVAKCVENIGYKINSLNKLVRHGMVDRSNGKTKVNLSV